MDLALSTSFCNAVMPVLADCRTCTPSPMPSSRLLTSLARLSSDCAVKKLVGLSRGVVVCVGWGGGVGGGRGEGGKKRRGRRQACYKKTGGGGTIGHFDDPSG